jgi:putative SOS response-associated peptidase YedK
MVVLQGEPTEEFEWFRVDPAIGNVRNKGPALIEPIEPERLF